MKIDKIVNDKRKEIQKFTDIKIRYLGILYKSILNGESIREIHKKIKKLVKIYGINKTIFNYMQKFAKEAKKAENIDKFFINPIAWSILTSLYYKEVQKKELELKDLAIQDEIKKAREEGKIFYLVSKHSDSAKDHIDYQGKIYIDEEWEKIDNSAKDYIEKNNFNTIQWVTSKPVYMITRPNCRHYFKAIEKDKVIKNSIDELIKENNLYSEKGHQILQTTIKEKYQERLKYHLELYKINKTDLLKKAIAKDRFLINKWNT